MTALAPEEVCFACRRLQESEQHYLAKLLQHLDNRDFATTYEQTASLCAVHFELALEGSRGGSRKDLLVRTQRRNWEELLKRLEAEQPDAKILQQPLASTVGGKGVRP